MKKFVSLVASLSILANSLLTPFTVLSQEVSPTPEPTPIEITAPTEIPSESPTATPTTTPIETATPTSTSIPEFTPEPLVTSTPDSTSNSTPEITPNSTPVVTTDKEDYHPTETAEITGNFFEEFTDFALKVFGGSTEDGNYKEDTYNVTTDSLGSFVFNYVLDNIFRPLYTVQVFNNIGDQLVEKSFTDSPLCQNDVNGVNDFTGQKDLNRMCGDYSSLPTTLAINWNWDDASWPGGNSGDGCALFDTDSDANANYALCVTIGGSPASFQSRILYSCNDSKPDRCAGKATIPVSASTSCTASVQNSDPFPTGDSSPNDTVAICSILMSDISSTTAKLIDVCSYPSQEPNSAPSDCIIATSAQTGKLEVVKQLSPVNDIGLFDLSIDSSILAIGIGNGTTGEQTVLTGNHIFNEAGNGSTSLSNYTTSVSCKDNNGTGSTVSTTGSFPWTVNVANNKDIVCTITNTRINNASLTIIKDAVPNDEQDFAFTTTGTGLSSFSLDDDGEATLSNTKVFSNLAAGTYSVAETAVIGWDLTSATCSDGSPVNAINLSSGENVICTFVNSRLPRLTVTKVVTNDNGGTKQVSDFPLFVNRNSVLSGVVNIYSTGSYVVSETGDNGYTAAISGDCDSSGNVTLAYGDDKICTITNNDKVGHLIVNKVTIPSNTQEVFTVTPTGLSSQTVSTGTPRDFTVNAGTYSVVEDAKTGWEETSNTCINVAIANGETEECTITNTQKGKILVRKETTPDGSQQSFDFLSSYNLSGFSLTDGQTNDSGFLSPSTYSVSENVPSGWDLDSAICSDGSSSTNIDLSAGETVTCVFTNSQRGSILGAKLEDLDGNLNTNDDQTNLVDWTIELYSCASDFTGCVLSATDLTEGSGYSFTNLVSGFYQVKEVLQNGWTNLTGLFINIALDYGEESTDNDFINFEKATIVVHKDVINPANNQTVDNTAFKVKLNGDNEQNISESNTVTYSNLTPGTYTVTESVIPSGYELVELTNDGVVNVQSGETHHVYLVNRQKVAKLTVVKNVINDNGGSKIAGNFTMNVSGVNPSQTSFSGNQNGTVVDLYAGEYSVDETEVSGYTKTLGQDCSGSITWGEEKTCVITNNDQTGTLTVNKVTIPEDLDAEFEITASGSGVIHGLASQLISTEADVDYTVDAGTYSVSEGVLGNWDETGNTCDEVTVANGEIKECTITNTKRGNVTVIKFNDKNVSGWQDEGEEVLNGWEIHLDQMSQFTGAKSSGQVTFSDIVPDTYLLGEQIKEGWGQSNIYCNGDDGIDKDNSHQVLVSAGQTRTCYIGNFEYASIGDYIWEDTNGDAIQDLGEPAIFGVTANLYKDDGDGIFEPLTDDLFIGTDTTGVGGTYLFGNLIPGDYWVDVEDSTVPAGYFTTTPDPYLVLGLESAEDFNLADFGYVPPQPEVVINKTNNKNNADNGDVVEYRLTVKNDGNVGLNNVIVHDALPGGFNYLLGTSKFDGIAVEDPVYIGNTLKWNIGTLSVDQSKTITYEVEVEDNVTDGTHTNLATCTADVARLERRIDCNIASSTVSLGTGISYGGNLVGQVLGASTELPATGNPSWLLLFAIGGLAGGILLKKKYAKN